MALELLSSSLVETRVSAIKLLSLMLVSRTCTYTFSGRCSARSAAFAQDNVFVIFFNLEAAMRDSVLLRA